MTDKNPVSAPGSTSIPVPGSSLAYMDVNAVAVKPPQFMESSAAAWFTIMEAQFQLRSITVGETKFFHVLAALPPETVSRLSTLTLSCNQYDTLKSDVLSLYEHSKSQLFEKLISPLSISSKPSLFLEQLSKVASKVGVNDDLVRHRFISALPTSIAPVVASQQDTPLKQLGKLADELLPFCQLQIAQVHSDPPSSGNVTRNHDRYHARSRSPKFHSNASTSYNTVTPFYEGQRAKICKGHIFYGDKAKSCRMWCQWPDKSSCKISPPSRSSSPAPPSDRNQEN